MSDETSKPQIKISWLFGIAIAFALFAAIGGYSARMTTDYSDYDQDRAAQRYDTLKKLQADENKQLNPVDAKGNPTAIWVDQDKGVISIPIDEAMAKEVTDLKAQTAGPGNEINPPSPAPAPAPAAAPATNVAPTAPVEKSAKPAKTPEPVKTTLTPGTINQPVFNTRKITKKSGEDAQPFKGFIIYGGVPIAVENLSVAVVPAAQTN